eukprot:CAMPEP_0175113200 /NCGR_PEP_ID=MMETSP0086_2-20121207/16009_1 /TAXON_ID=136419 /ORGANISM="Unknown Unknown, Strain D1" /LENGTH=345 /DNA_ID=CAMNT_0016392393 /DNA_START=81 /DNA_END=1115 /DNA_ORIENTATION=+
MISETKKQESPDSANSTFISTQAQGIAENVQQKCSAIGKNCFSVLSWVGKILWVLVPLLITAVLVSILVSSLSDQSTWSDVLGAREKFIHVDFMVLSVQDQDELTEVFGSHWDQGCGAPQSAQASTQVHAAVFQKGRLVLGNYVLVGSGCSNFEAGVYVVTPAADRTCITCSSGSLSDLKKASETSIRDEPAVPSGSLCLVHVQDIMSDCRYVVKRGTYQDQVYQPSLRASATLNGTCSNSGGVEQGTGNGRIFLRSGDLETLTGDPLLLPAIGEGTSRLVLKMDQALPSDDSALSFREVPTSGLTLSVTGPFGAKIRVGGQEGVYVPSDKKVAVQFEVFEGKLH